MTSLGLDYSDARPGGAALAAAGVAAVGRYLANDSRGITAGEYADLVAHGIGLWLVKESQSADLSVSMLNGYNKGVADALAAEAAIKQVGLPAGAPVFWAADFDVAPGSARVAQAEAYVDGWNTIIPAGRRGGYGGLWFLNYLHSKGKVELLWECASTSFRHGVSPSQVPLHIQQTTLTPPIPGTDHNYIFDTSVASLDATLIGDDMPLTPADIGNLLNFPAYDGGPTISSALKQLVGRVSGIGDTVEAPVIRDGAKVSQIQDNANTGTIVRQLVAQVGALQQAVAALSAGQGADPAKIQAAAEAGAAAALANLKLEAVTS